MNGRLVPTFCARFKEGFIPLWQLTYQNSEIYGEIYLYNHFHHSGDLTPCYWDTLDKKIVFGKIIDYYVKETPYKVGETVYVEKQYRNLKEDIVEKVFFEVYEPKILLASSDEISYYLSAEEKDKLNKDDVFEIRIWKPYYVLKSGEVIKYEHKLYKKSH